MASTVIASQTLMSMKPGPTLHGANVVANTAARSSAGALRMNPARRSSAPSPKATDGWLGTMNPSAATPTPTPRAIATRRSDRFVIASGTVESVDAPTSQPASVSTAS